MPTGEYKEEHVDNNRLPDVLLGLVKQGAKVTGVTPEPGNKWTVVAVFPPDPGQAGAGDTTNP